MRGERPTAKQLTGKTIGQDVLLSRRRQIIGRLRYTLQRKGRGRTSWYTWPVIIPPVYAKQALIETIRPAWVEAREALEESDRVLFFDYSVASLDIEAEKLFQRSLREGNIEHVDIVNPDPNCTARYAGLLPKTPLRWYPNLDQFLDTSSFD